MRKNNIGITGASGTLGRILVQELEEKEIQYTCFGGDICFKEDIEKWIHNNKFDAIIHFAAIVPTNEVKENPDKAYRVNVVGTQNLINEIKLSKQNPWLFYASTCHVYKSTDKPIKEIGEISPISIYGSTKYEAEKFVNQNYENSCIGRIFSFYHNTQQESFLYPKIIARLENEDLNKPFELYGAKSIRDFLNAETIVDIIIKLMIIKIRGIYNIGSGEGTTIENFVQNLTNKKLNIKNLGENNYLVADITKLNNLINEK